MGVSDSTHPRFTMDDSLCDGENMERKKKASTRLEKPPKQEKGGCPVQEKPKRKRKKSIVEGPGSEIKIGVLERMKEVRSSLSPDFPILVRPMLPSHVSGCFWLGLPKKFCDLHLPKEDKNFILEDQNGCKHGMKYLWQKTGLSGGWKAFAVDHKLQEGDVVIFHLVEPTKFKVYIVRSSEFDEADGALVHSLPMQDPPLMEVSLEVDTTTNKRRNRSGHKLENSMCNTDRCLPGQPEHEGGDDLAEQLDEISSSKSFDDFETGTGRDDDFTIVMNGVVLDSALPMHVRAKYRKLCLSRKSNIHEKLLLGLNAKLAMGMISETVNIAEAMRASDITTSVEEFTTWGKTLKAFKDMGMDVGFLLDRLDQLMSLSTKSKRIKDARMERAAAEKELRVLKARVLEVKSEIDMLDSEIDALDKNEKGPALLFREISTAPWG